MTEPQDSKPVDPNVTHTLEEFTLDELEKLLETSEECYYAVDPIRDPKSKRKLIDPRSVLTSEIVRSFYVSWGLRQDSVIRVTRNVDAIEDLLNNTAVRTVSYFTDLFHKYVVKIFTVDKPIYKAELHALTTGAVEFLDTLLSLEKISKLTIGPSDLRSHVNYYDHLANSAVYWLAVFACYNKMKRATQGSVEVWRSKNKAELARVTGGNTTAPVTYYDIYDRKLATADIEPMKKNDLSLVISGFYGALLHDISLNDEPRILISRKGGIDDRLKAHVDDSNIILKKKLLVLYDDRPLTRSIIKNHHEYIDGSGYPAGKKSKDIHLFAQLLSVVDMYEEYITRYNRSTVIKFMAKGAGQFFSTDVLRAFLSILRPFDTGENVHVYEGNTPEPVMDAEILASPNRFRPRIRITEAFAPTHQSLTGQEIDLSLDENIVFSI